MWQPYLRLIKKNCPQALNILDRFHIVAKMNDALDQVRAHEARRMKQSGHQPVLRKTRWCLLKRKQNLTSRQKFRLRDLLRYNLKTVPAYLLKETLQQLWEYNSPAWAAKFLDAWCHQTMLSRIDPMKKIARSLRKHRELILNYFRANKALSSGVVEGLNNKAKITMRKSYGFRTFPVLELAHITHLPNFLNLHSTTISSDESLFKSEDVSIRIGHVGESSKSFHGETLCQCLPRCPVGVGYQQPEFSSSAATRISEFDPLITLD